MVVGINSVGERPTFIRNTHCKPKHVKQRFKATCADLKSALQKVNPWLPMTPFLQPDEKLTCSSPTQTARTSRVPSWSSIRCLF